MKKIILSVLLASSLVCSSGLPTFASGQGLNDDSVRSVVQRDVFHLTRDQFASLINKFRLDIDCLEYAVCLCGVTYDENIDIDTLEMHIPTYREGLISRGLRNFRSDADVIRWFRSFGDNLILRTYDDCCVLRRVEFDALGERWVSIYNNLVRYGIAMGYIPTLVHFDR